MPTHRKQHEATLITVQMRIPMEMKNSTAAEVTTDTMSTSLFSVSHSLSVTVMGLFILINCSKIIFCMLSRGGTVQTVSE